MQSGPNLADSSRYYRLLPDHHQVRDSGSLAGFQSDWRGDTSKSIDPGPGNGLRGRQEAL